MQCREGLLLCLHFFHFPEQVGSENKVVQLFVGGTHDIVFTALPLLASFVDEEDMLTDAHDGVHVVGIHDSRDVVFFSQLVDQLIDDHGCLGVEAGIWLIAEEILAPEHGRWRCASSSPR